jgi:MFS family permease
MITLTGGAFLAAFALKLGASNMIIGVLAAIPPLAQLIQLPSLYLVERVRNRRGISVYASAAGRLFWLLIALIPFFFSPKVGLSVLVVGMLLHSAFAAVSNCAWNPWMRDLVPQDQLGSFFAKRMRLATVLGVVLSIIAGVYIDFWKRAFISYEMYGYSILFFLGFVAGMLGVYFISTIPEAKMTTKGQGESLLEVLLKPFHDVNFKNLTLFSGWWSLSANLAAPFFTVYMLKRLELNMSVIIGLTVLSQLVYIVFLGIWGRFSDRFSNKSVLRVSGPLFLICIIAWTFTTMPEKYFLTIPLLIVIHIFMGVSTAGVNLASGSIGLKLAPQGHAAAFLAGRNFVNSLAMGIAPILGGVLATYFAERELSWTLRWTGPNSGVAIQTLNFQQWDFFFFIAFLVGLYSIHRLSMVKEFGEVEEGVVIHELIAEVRRNIRNISSVGGLRQMAQFPFSIMRTPVKRKG